MLPSKTKIACFIPNLGGGGAERVMVNLIEGLTSRGYPVDLLLVRNEGEYIGMLPQGVHIVDLAASRTIWSLRPLVRYLRRERPSVLFSALDYANIIAICARLLAGVQTRTVVSCHTTLSRANFDWPWYRRGLYMLLIRLFYPLADQVVAVSEGSSDDLSRAVGLPRKRIACIVNPVVTPELRAAATEQTDHPWFRAGEPPVVLAAARLEARKGHDLLMHAFSIVHAKRPVRLLILGEGPDRERLEDLSRTLGIDKDFSMPGFSQNPYALMSRSAVFVLSSRREALPTVLIEAMACGVPVVATDCPFGPSEILGQGQYGHLVPTGNVAAIAEAIEEVLDGKGRRPTNEAVARFELGAVTERYLGVLLPQGGG